MGGKPAVAILGAGRVGTALGILLHRAGYPIRGVVCRSLTKAEESVRLIGAGAPSADVVQGALGAEIVIFAVPDDALEKTAARVRAGGKFGPGDIWMHTSGAAPALTLWPGARGGEAGGDGTEREGAGRPGLLSMHPVQSVADPRTGAERLVGAFFGLEGDEAALLAGERIVRDIGGVPFRIAPGGKALYHAAACVASNYLVTLLDASLELFSQAGVDRKVALAALRRLVAATAANAAALGVPQALTGPIDRGDESTILSHLAAIRAMPAGPDRDRIEALYRSLGVHTLHVARKKRGASAPGHDGIERMLLHDKEHRKWID